MDAFLLIDLCSVSLAWIEVVLWDWSAASCSEDFGSGWGWGCVVRIMLSVMSIARGGLCVWVWGWVLVGRVGPFCKG